VKKLMDIYRSLPPLYFQYHWQEMALPQHSEDLPSPDDNPRRFLWMSDHVRGYGKWFHRSYPATSHVIAATNRRRLGECPTGAFHGWISLLI